MVNQSVLRDQFRGYRSRFSVFSSHVRFSRIYNRYFPGVVSTILKRILLYISRIVNVLKRGIAGNRESTVDFDWQLAYPTQLQFRNG
jgi:hypothetical protein